MDIVDTVDEVDTAESMMQSRSVYSPVPIACHYSFDQINRAVRRVAPRQFACGFFHSRNLSGCVDQGNDLFGQSLTGQLFLKNHSRRARISQRLGVALLFKLAW